MTRRGELSDEARGTARRLVPGGLGLTAATLAANLLGYALTLVAARQLPAADWGALASLLGFLAVGNVSALGVQATTARRVAARSRTEGLDAMAAVAAVATTATAALLAWPLAAYLHLPSAVGPLWVAVGLAPLAWLGALQGRAQGSERFGLLAVLVVVGAVGRTGAALVATGTRDYVTVAAAGALGTVGAAAVATVLCRGLRPAGAARARSGELRQPLQETARAAVAFLGLFVLTNLDLVLARHFLDADLAGHYAVGSVVAKAAFWLPQAVGIIAFPLMARAGENPAVTRAALAVVASCGAVVTAGAAILGRPAVLVVGGSQYSDMAGLAWVFAMTGSAYAVTQVLVLARIAHGGRYRTVPLWVAAALEVVLVSGWLHASPGQVAGTACSVSVALAVALYWLAGHGPGR